MAKTQRILKKGHVLNAEFVVTGEHSKVEVKWASQSAKLIKVKISDLEKFYITENNLQ